MNLVKKIIGFVMDSLETIVFIGSIYIVIYIYLFMPTSVKGASMEPTLYNNDRLIINKIAYKLKPLERGDIIVIKSPKNPDIEYVKRLIELPNDTVLINNGDVYINGIQLPKDFISSKTNVWEGGFVKENQPYKVPKDFIFVMGDNRQRSSDSREFGPIPISSILGQAPFRYFPQDKFGWLLNPFPQNLRSKRH